MRHPRRRALDESFVDSIMKKDVGIVDPDATVLDASASLVKRSDGCLVVSRDGAVFGILTEADVVHKVVVARADPSKVYVKDVMSTPVFTVPATASITHAAELITEYNVRRLVVVDDIKGLVGLISTEDIARWLARKSDFEDSALNALARLKDSDSPYR